MEHQNDVGRKYLKKGMKMMEPIKGIDVSEHQGQIDWEKVKADGIRFAMIRCGYGSDLKSQDDKRFERNVQECERVGIPWGAYLYSYALDVQEARSEAAHVIRLLGDKSPAYPIAFDMEDADGYKKKRGMPSNQELVRICDTFLSIVQDAGYEVILYANKYWLTVKLNDKALEKYKKWVAQWNDHLTYEGQCSIWQYTANGRVTGIYGEVDMNFAYEDFSKGNGNTEAVKTVATKLSSPYMYRVTSPLIGYRTAIDAKNRNNKVTTVEPGTYYIFNSSQGMYNVTKGEGIPGSWINPNEKE